MSVRNQYCAGCHRQTLNAYETENKTGLCPDCARIEDPPFWTPAKVAELLPTVKIKTKEGIVERPIFPCRDEEVRTYGQLFTVDPHNVYPGLDIAHCLNHQGVLNAPPAGHEDLEDYRDGKYPAPPPILGPRPDWRDIRYEIIQAMARKSP